PVSLTVQVQPALYKELKAWPDTTNISEVTGKARIPTVEVVRAALEEMLADAALQKRVAKRVIKNLI
ncbi:hypothetical protein ACMX2H_18740, partial [Arthrobacter sulfonylureivorans]|uniref:hypothetical protein n=1 Tax=Arthrobacter sulfonylureivorans TaxID=2486855 RepID=UPI0039E3ACC9